MDKAFGVHIHMHICPYLSTVVDTMHERVDQTMHSEPCWFVQSQRIECGCRSSSRRWRCLLHKCSSSRAESASCSKRGAEAARCLQCSSRPAATSPSWGGGGSQWLWLWWSQWVHHLLSLRKEYGGCVEFNSTSCTVISFHSFKVNGSRWGG